MSRVARWLAALAALLVGRRRRRDPERERIVPKGSPDRRAEWLVAGLLFAAAFLAAGFVALYAIDSLGNRTQLFGIALGLCFGCVGAALVVAGQRLVVTEELEEDYPEPEHPEAQEEIAQLVDESGSKITRKGLLIAAGGAAGTAMGAAALAPALSLGPALDTEGLYQTPWKRGRRLVDKEGKPLAADAISIETFYTAYPEGAKQDKLGAPLVVVRLEPGDLRLPARRESWAPRGIVAFSKICTHAACAVSLYRKPTVPALQPRRALVCPCHYSTFDPATGGQVIYGPAGRPLPQLPLIIDARGELRAAGNFSGPVGPSFGGVRERRPST